MQDMLHQNNRNVIHIDWRDGHDRRRKDGPTKSMGGRLAGVVKLGGKYLRIYRKPRNFWRKWSPWGSEFHPRMIELE